MNVGMQWTNLERQTKQMKSNDPRFDPQTIDFEAEIDSSLSYPENLDNFKRKYNLHEETTEGEYKDRIAKEQMNLPERQREGYHPRENRYANKSMSDIVFMKHQTGDVHRGAPQQRSVITNKIRFFDNSPASNRFNPEYQKTVKRYDNPIGPRNETQRYAQPIGPQRELPNRWTNSYHAVKSVGHGASKAYHAAERGFRNPVHFTVKEGVGWKTDGKTKKLRIW